MSSSSADGRRVRESSRRRAAPRLIATAMAVTAVLAACTAAPAVQDYRAEAAHQQVSLDEAPALPQLLAANDELGLAMLRSGVEANVVVSPFSAYVALAMLAEGARGGTAESFDLALGAAGAGRTDAVNALRGALLVHDGDPALAAADELPDEPLLHLADRVLLDDDLIPEDAFLEVLARGYDAGIETVDLGTAAVTPVLDEWVNRETGGLIPKSAIVPKPNLRLVLQDAIVLAARWRVAFDPNGTTEQPFEAPDGPVQVEMMQGIADGAWPVTEADGWTAVRLPYMDGFVADLVLPPVGVDPADADAATLASLSAGLAGAAGAAPSVHVSVPKLDLAARPLDLTSSLTDVGLGELFVAPDLSGITPGASLSVDQAVQQARLRMNEEGTVAAAVTEIAVDESAAPLPEVEVRFDRPFLMRIAHADTELTLFLAVVRDPSAG